MLAIIGIERMRVFKELKHLILIECSLENALKVLVDREDDLYQGRLVIVVEALRWV